MKQTFFVLASTLTLAQLAFSSTATYAKYAPEIVFGFDAPHLHLLSNHVPIFVTLSGLIVMATGLWSKNRGIAQVALTLMFLGIAGGILTFWLGQQAYKPVRGLADSVGQDWLDLHMERAEQVIWVFWVAGSGVATAWVLGWKKHRLATPAAMISAVLGLSTLGLSTWIADAGGKIRHSEFRLRATPPVQGSKSAEGHDLAPHNH